jgi:6-pyruvoyltetrahydropterin/6-carboxytetrahydropterin synthase
MTHTIIRVLEFDAGHRVAGHEGKCATLHGHRYKVEIEATADVLDDIGRVIDFSVLKSAIGGWLDRFWDHTCVIWQDDEVLKVLRNLPGNKGPFAAPFNPTAENMAEYLLRVVCPRELAGTNVKVVAVTVWETPNCKAVARL